MFRVITANLNGIRSAARKGFFDWFGQQDADVVCVQEIKCSQDDMTPEFMAPHDYTGYFQHAVKKGYSGAGVYTRHEPDEVIIGFGSEEFDPEGRYVEARFGDLSVISVYVPSDGALYCGDCLANGYLPNLDAGSVADWRVWLASLERIAALAPRIIVAGHGPVATGDEAPLMIERVREILRQSIEAGRSPTS